METASYKKTPKTAADAYISCRFLLHNYLPILRSFILGNRPKRWSNLPPIYYTIIL